MLILSPHIWHIKSVTFVIFNYCTIVINVQVSLFDNLCNYVLAIKNYFSNFVLTMKISVTNK